MRSKFFLGMLVFCLTLAACQPAAVSTETPEPHQPAPTTPPQPTKAPTALPTPTSQPTPSTQPSPSRPAQGADQPAAQPASGSGTPIHRIEMFDLQSGWGANETDLYRTPDGGRTWTNATPAALGGQNAPMEPFFFSAQVGWVLAADAQNPNQGTLYRTTDSGQTWETSPAPFSIGRAQLLADGLHGFFLAGRGVAAGSEAVDLFSTTDGGATWNMVYHLDPARPDDPNGIPFGGTKNGLEFADPQHGWVGGFEPAEAFSYLFASGDGGKTWKQVHLSILAGLEHSQMSVQAPHFFDPQNGVLGVVFFEQTASLVFYATQDGGATWTPGAPVQSNGLISFPTPEDIKVWDGATFYSSADAGKTWQSLTPNVNLSQTIAAMDFVDAQNGWALSAGASGVYQIYRTQDGGATWQPL